MDCARRVRTSVAFLAVVIFPVLPAFGLPISADTPDDLHRAYFLEHHARDYAKARALYETVLDEARDAEIKSIAGAGAARCRDALAAQHFATLMPPESVVYVELSRPGMLFGGLAQMMGLTKSDIRDLLAKRPATPSDAPFYIPKEIAISPALLDALNTFGGAALALTEINFEGGPPSGVLVVHHGDMTLLKGLLETAFQFAPTAETVHGMPTFGVSIPEVGAVTGVLTESLLIVGTDRALVQGAVSRLLGKSKGSLASREDLKDNLGRRPEGTLFGFADLQKIFKLVKERASDRDLEDLRMANVLADLESLRWATFSAGIDNGSLGLDLAVRYADGHHSIVYNLLRMPPMTRECLKLVPADAAAVFGFGLNPAITGMVANAAEGADQTEPPGVTGLDIPREFFGNVREVCVFAQTGDLTSTHIDGERIKIPNVGILLAVNDIAKSRALWDQIFTLPGLVAGSEPVPPKAVRIGTTDAKAYTIPQFGQIYMTDLENCIAIGVTRTALKGAVRAHNKKQSILEDDVMGNAIARMPRDTTIMAAVHVGRVARTAAGAFDTEEAMAARAAASLCDNMVVWLGVGQSPVQLTIHAAVSGLPDINKALDQFGPMINGAAGMAMRARAVERVPIPQSQDDPDAQPGRVKSRQPGGL